MQASLFRRRQGEHFDHSVTYAINMIALLSFKTCLPVLEKGWDFMEVLINLWLLIHLIILWLNIIRLLIVSNCKREINLESRQDLLIMSFSIADVISEFKEKIAGLKKAVKELEIKEKEDRQLRIADNQIKKAQAVIDNKDRETGGRPKRKWFQTHEERTKEKGEQDDSLQGCCAA